MTVVSDVHSYLSTDDLYTRECPDSPGIVSVHPVKLDGTWVGRDLGYGPSPGTDLRGEEGWT